MQVELTKKMKICDSALPLVGNIFVHERTEKRKNCVGKKMRQAPPIKFFLEKKKTADNLSSHNLTRTNFKTSHKESDYNLSNGFENPLLLLYPVLPNITGQNTYGFEVSSLKQRDTKKATNSPRENGSRQTEGGEHKWRCL